MPELETAHLIMRQFRLDDLDALAAIVCDQEVTRYIVSKPAQTASREQIAAMLTKYIDYWQKHGIGRFALIHKGNGELIGSCGLRWFVPEQEPEVVYMLANAYWGQGLATEAGLASLRFGFE